MKYLPPLSAEALEKYLSMPRWSGHVICPRYLEGEAQRTYEKQWGEWFRANHKSWWPAWAEQYIAERKASNER